MVVNVRWMPFDVYIGRAVPRAKDPRCRVSSPFQNPFCIGRKFGNRQQVVQRYETWLREKIQADPARWIEELKKLRGKRLGCWCYPQECHGAVLVKLIKEFCDGGELKD